VGYREGRDQVNANYLEYGQFQSSRSVNCEKIIGVQGEEIEIYEFPDAEEHPIILRTKCYESTNSMNPQPSRHVIKIAQFMVAARESIKQ
jgi:hypothetical protein